MGGKRKKGRLDPHKDDSDTDSIASDLPPDSMDCTLSDPRVTLANDSGLPPLPDDPGSSSDQPVSASARNDPPSSTAQAPDTAPSPPDEPFLAPSGSFLTVQPLNPNVSFRRINVFWPDKQIQAICGTPLHHEAPANGTLIIKTEKRSQTKLLLKTTTFCNQPVRVSLHQSRNSAKGTIFAPELRFMTEEEILDGLRLPEGVSHVRRMTTFRDGQRRDTSLLTITFNHPQIPEFLIVGRLRYRVEPFIPNPLRCYNCQRYGHGSKFCKNPATCKECGKDAHDGSPCTAPKKCLGCQKTDHFVDSKECPKWKTEKEICSVKVTHNVSYPEARRIVESRLPTPSSQSYAATASQSVSNASSVQPKTPRKQSIEVQTDPLPGIPPLQLLPRLAASSADSVTQTTAQPGTSDPVTECSVSRTPVTAGPQRNRSRSPVKQAMGSARPNQSDSVRQKEKSGLPTLTDTDRRDQRSRPAVKVAMGRARSVSQTRPSSREGFWELAAPRGASRDQS